MKTSWAIIRVKFTDDNSEPFADQYYNDLFTKNNTGSEWNMVKYFKDYSHGKLDLTGSKVFGWYEIDKSVEDYNALLGGARDALIGWARKAAMDDGVDLSPFFSVVVCTNLWQDIGASPTGAGVVCQGPLTARQWVLAHEMGHVYGMKHSRMEGSDADYQDRWDIMSVGNTWSASDTEFTLKGPGVNASNMRGRGWLDETRVWKMPNGSFDTTVTLRPLVRHDLEGYLTAELPGGYLAEFRVREGWDGSIPRPAVLIHRFAAGASYIQLGNFGNQDLIEGDSFGNPEPDVGDLESSLNYLFSSFSRMDVISIKPEINEAVLQIRHHQRRDLGIAIDPMALILSGRAYLIWVEMHHPHVPKVLDLKNILRMMTAEERRAALARAKSLGEFGSVARKAIEAFNKTLKP